MRRSRTPRASTKRRINPRNHTKKHERVPTRVELMLKDEAYAIMGAAMEVYKELGPGFLEAVYQEALEVELALRAVPSEPQKELVICYKGRRLNKGYVADLICYGQI